jgi:hypothetical protein
MDECHRPEIQAETGVGGDQHAVTVVQYESVY